MMPGSVTTVRGQQRHRTVALTCAALAMVGVSVFLTGSPVKALAGDLAAITQASNLDSDPQDFQAVTTVCTVCHNASQFLTTPRSSGRWEQVFAQMSGYGANGTDDQLDRVVSYFQKNLTVINVNTSPVEDIQLTLQVNDQATAAIMARRVGHPFAGIDDLAKVPGVDRSVLEKLSAKKCLQF
jgi:DNA uptake protein ComE-like DNA-binding protein